MKRDALLTSQRPSVSRATLISVWKISVWCKAFHFEMTINVWFTLSNTSTTKIIIKIRKETLTTETLESPKTLQSSPETSITDDLLWLHQKLLMHERTLSRQKRLDLGNFDHGNFDHRNLHRGSQKLWSGELIRPRKVAFETKETLNTWNFAHQGNAWTKAGNTVDTKQWLTTYISKIVYAKLASLIATIVGLCTKYKTTRLLQHHVWYRQNKLLLSNSNTPLWVTNPTKAINKIRVYDKQWIMLNPAFK